jgi:hypothetical protein
MNSTRNVLQECFGAAEYARLLDNANQINIFGEPVKELSKKDLLAVLAYTIQSNQMLANGHRRDTPFTPVQDYIQSGGLS